MKKILYSTLMFLLVFINISNSLPKENDFIIVRDKDKIKKYNKLFAEFINSFKFDKYGNLKYYVVAIDNNDNKHIEKDFVIDVFIEERYNNDLDFSIYLVGHSENYNYRYYNIATDTNGKKFYIQEYHDMPSDNSLTCFFGIIFEEDCIGKPNFGGIEYKDINVLKKYLKNN